MFRPLSIPVLSVAFLSLVAYDQPRRDVPVYWNSLLTPESWGTLVLRREGDVDLRYVTARLSQAPLEIVPYSYFADDRPKTAPLADLAERFRTQTRRRVLAGINGGFFDVKTGLPIGFLLRDGDMEFFNMPQGFRRSMVGFTAPRAGRSDILIASPAQMPRAWLDAFVSRHGGVRQSFPVHHVNVPGGRDAFAVFTPRYGRRMKAPSDGIYLAARREPGFSSSWYSVEPSVRQGDEVVIPADGIVLAMHGNSRRLAAQFPVGTRLRQRWTLPEAWQGRGVVHGLLAGPRLLEKGQVRVSAVEEGLANLRSPDRVALGLTSQGEAILLWAHRRSPGKTLDFHETARLLAGLGAVEAIALDGGRSRAVMATATEPYRQDTFVFSGRPIANALLLAMVD